MLESKKKQKTTKNLKRLTTELSEQMEEGKKLDEGIKKRLESIGFKV